MLCLVIPIYLLNYHFLMRFFVYICYVENVVNLALANAYCCAFNSFYFSGLINLLKLYKKWHINFLTQAFVFIC